MSRTDKDLPFWMLATYWEPNHVKCQHSVWRRSQRECDLPEAPVLMRPAKNTWRTQTAGCCWVPTWDHYYRAYGSMGVPAWFVRAYCLDPERRQVRDDCRAALKEYNANGEVDTIPSITQHRHRARWLYW